MEQISTADALTAQHESWLKHPMTAKFLQGLDSQERHFVLKVSGIAYTGTDQDIRNLAVGLNTIKAIKGWVTNTAQFVEIVNNKQ